jgi:hypothetical protein
VGGCHPRRGSFSFRMTKNPIQRSSGEKNGAAPATTSLIGLDSRSLSDRV